MTILLKPKEKYLHVHNGKYKGGPNAATLKHRTKIGYQRHVDIHGEPPKVIKRVDGATGKFRLERV